MPSLYNRIKSRIDRHRHRKKSLLKLEQPVISFTFDDAFKTAFTFAGEILNENSCHATYFISLGLMEMESAFGKMFSPDDLQQAVLQGHELGCHTYFHSHPFSMSLDEIKNSILRNQEKIESILGDYTFKNFSYPFGEVTADIKKTAAKRFLSSRTSYYGINTGPTDLNSLKAVGLYETLIDPGGVKNIIEAAISKNGWLIFYTHDVRNNYSEFGCSPRYFKNVLKFCGDNKIEVLNINETISKYILRTD